ncbi:MAG: hypothetical protein F4Z00_16415 [Acidimicrobiaceae bacterium]|nr:hypothetical protein [Acidimicrobiaceae bacterium]MDE0495685.1 hypothetical protein [Acidimicrobiaceae bacterium]MDE0665782.1 hypothetical protein [Acidimicrobiaceae bacterium]MXW88807.1 hypothetical protein [Acidimicrobiaceae bacterium]MXY10755.1 hypothetical protein [Acidimicrobiaceae bacterium]
MAYDPQRDRPRHRPGPREASAVDSILDTEVAPPRPRPAPDAVAASDAAPVPTGSWSDRLLYSAGISTLLGAGAALVTLWWLWRRLRR